MKRSYQVSIIIIAGLIFYLNCLFNAFVWDDEFLVRDNPYIRNIPKAASCAFSRDILPVDFYKNEIKISAVSNYYRPIQIISYALDFCLWDAFAFGYHFTNLLLHLANGVLVYLLLCLLQPVSLISFIAALFFIVHPIHIEAVTYISGRADLLAGFFILSAFCLFIRQRKKERPEKLYGLTALILFSSFLAALSKEYALILPILFLSFDCAYNKLKRKTLKQYLLFIPVLIFYGLLRIFALGFSKALPGDPSSGLLLKEFPVRFLSFLKSIIFYFRIIFVPTDLHMERAFAKPNSVWDIWVIGALFLILIALFLAIRERKKNPVFLFLWFWFVLLVLFQSYIFVYGFMMSEHFLYLASISIFFGVALFFNFLFSKFEKKRSLIAFLLIALVIFYGSLTAIHNLNWKNNITFYRWTLKFSPNSIKSHINLANEYVLLNRFDLALEEYKIANSILDRIDIKRFEEKPKLVKQLKDATALTYYNLGVLTSLRGDYVQSEIAYRLVLEILPDYNLARDNLACLLSKTNRPNEAINELQAILKDDPNDLKAYYNLGAIYSNNGRKGKARQVWKQALKIDPNNEQIKAALAELLKK